MPTYYNKTSLFHDREDSWTQAIADGFDLYKNQTLGKLGKAVLDQREARANFPQDLDTSQATDYLKNKYGVQSPEPLDLPTYSREELDLMAERIQVEQYQLQKLEAQNEGVSKVVGGFIGGIGAELLDPVSIALSIGTLGAVGAARAGMTINRAMQLQKKTSLTKRAMVDGGIDGLVFGVAEYALGANLESDHITEADIAISAVGGALLGGGLSAIGRGVSYAYGKGTNQVKPIPKRISPRASQEYFNKAAQKQAKQQWARQFEQDLKTWQPFFNRQLTSAAVLRKKPKLKVKKRTEDYATIQAINTRLTELMPLIRDPEQAAKAASQAEWQKKGVYRVDFEPSSGIEEVFTIKAFDEMDQVEVATLKKAQAAEFEALQLLKKRKKIVMDGYKKADGKSNVSKKWLAKADQEIAALEQTNANFITDEFHPSVVQNALEFSYQLTHDHIPHNKLELLQAMQQAQSSKFASDVVQALESPPFIMPKTAELTEPELDAQIAQVEQGNQINQEALGLTDEQLGFGNEVAQLKKDTSKLKTLQKAAQIWGSCNV